MLKLKSIPQTGKPTMLWYSWYCLTGLSPWTQLRRIFKGLPKNLFFAGHCVQSLETNSEEGWEKQQTLKALSHTSVLKKPGCIHCLFPVGKKSWGEDREGIFQFPEETTSPCPSPSCNGTPPRKSKGMHSPRCARSKIQGFAQLSRHALNHVL